MLLGPWALFAFRDPIILPTSIGSYQGATKRVKMVEGGLIFFLNRKGDKRLWGGGFPIS